MAKEFKSTIQSRKRKTLSRIDAIKKAYKNEGFSTKPNETQEQFLKRNKLTDLWDFIKK